MKYIILLGDGMADEPLAELNNKTPLQHAQTPRMDGLARICEQGLADTVPAGYAPGSDVANLSVFGYDPTTCYTGRSPLEAASMGVELGPNDISFRLNLVYLQPQSGRIYMNDFSAGHITTPEAAEIIASLQAELGNEEFSFHPGVSYRHLLVWKGGKEKMTCTPPHDITNQSIDSYLPIGEGAEELIQLITSSQLLLKRHPINLDREKRGDKPANSIWLWGQGRKPHMETMAARYGLRGAVISAVDLLKGIGVCAGLDIINVPGATGYIDTNYRGKAEAALEALKTRDFVYVHVEAPDEASHAGNLAHKLKAIEDFDKLVVGTVLDGIAALGPHRVLVLPDHPTPVAKMTHTSDPVPYLLYDSAGAFLPACPADEYSEVAAGASGIRITPGCNLFVRMVKGQ